MTDAKDRRASRAWRLSPAGAAAADADQHREHRACRAKNWVPAPDATENSDPEAFFNLFCSTCHYFLSEKGLMMQMLANPSSICFSTDQRPQGVELQDEAAKMPGMCDCKVQDFACGCGARLGYHLTSPCEVCDEEGTKQRWFLCPRCIEAEPGSECPRTPRWAEVPQETQAQRPHGLPQFGQSRDEKIAKPTPLSDVNGRETGSKGAKNEPKGKDDAILQVARPTLDTKSIDPKCSMETTKRLAELERREQAVSAKEEQLNLRELQLLRLEAKVNVSTSQTSQERVPWKADRDFGTHLPEKSEKDMATSSEVIRVQGMQGIPTAAKPDLADRGVSPRELSAPTTQVSAETLSADFERLQQARIDAWEAQQRVAKATEHVALAEAHTQDAAHPQGRLEYSQRLAEKRKELERWQKALEERSKALEELEKSLSDADGKLFAKASHHSGSGPFLANLQADAVHAASAAAKAMVGAGFTASKIVVAVAKPMFGAVKIAGSAAFQFGVSTYAAAVARANEEAQERAIAQATALRRSKYYASASPGLTSHTGHGHTSHGHASYGHMDFRDGSGVPPPRRTWESRSPQPWGRGAWSPGWQPSPIYPASPAPSHLPPVMEREGLLGWIRRNSGCGTRNHMAYPVRYPACG